MYANDEIYTGVLVAHEEKGNDSWFILEKYIVEKNNGDIYNMEDYELKPKLAVNIRNINKIEIFTAQK